MKIIVWNLNHRLGYGSTNMPEFVAETIREKKSDIIILTECCNRILNWQELKNKMFRSDPYLVFQSDNDQGQENDVMIAVNKDAVDVISSMSYFANGHTAPDHLQLVCKEKETKKEFVVAGIRIHSDRNLSNIDKNRQLELVLNNLSKYETAILAGDFNNYRRGFHDAEWSLDAIDVLGEKYAFSRYTPDGSSIYKEYLNNDDYAFAEDHFLTKGVGIDLKPYDRSFCDKDSSTYIWGHDFQKDYGKDSGGKFCYESIPTPFPDHAILEAEIQLL